jgi:hypothetical protein
MSPKLLVVRQNNWQANYPHEKQIFIKIDFWFVVVDSLYKPPSGVLNHIGNASAFMVHLDYSRTQQKPWNNIISRSIQKSKYL